MKKNTIKNKLISTAVSLFWVSVFFITSGCSRKMNLPQENESNLKQIKETLDDINKKVEEGKAKDIILFCGNPGTGKSTLLNAIIGKTVFQSGFSIGKGLTTDMTIHQERNIWYVDTPGLDDVVMLQKAGEEIEKALKLGGNYRIFFVVTLEAGRIHGSDITTIDTVCDAIGVSFEYCIIVNKLSDKAAKKLLINNGEGLARLKGIAEGVLHKKPNDTIIVEKIKNANNEDNILLPPKSIEILKKVIEIDTKKELEKIEGTDNKHNEKINVSPTIDDNKLINRSRKINKPTNSVPGRRIPSWFIQQQDVKPLDTPNFRENCAKTQKKISTYQQNMMTWGATGALLGGAGVGAAYLAGAFTLPVIVPAVTAIGGTAATGGIVIVASGAVGAGFGALSKKMNEDGCFVM